MHLQMSYTPPAGAIGHAVAKLFGLDLKAQLDRDFVRLKGLLEEGRTRVRGERVEWEQPVIPKRPRWEE